MTASDSQYYFVLQIRKTQSLLKRFYGQHVTDLCLVTAAYISSEGDGSDSRHSLRLKTDNTKQGFSIRFRAG